jgi:hypothetical protein
VHEAAGGVAHYDGAGDDGPREHVLVAYPPPYSIDKRGKDRSKHRHTETHTHTYDTGSRTQVPYLQLACKETYECLQRGLVH